MFYINRFRDKFKEKQWKFDKLNLFLSILPITLLTLIIMVYPLVSVFYHGFTKWTISGTTFIGLENYRNLITSGKLLFLFKNNLIMLSAIPILIFISLIIAYLLFEEIWGWKVFRILFYLPAVLSSVIIGFLFRTFFALYGPLNEILRLTNLELFVIDWLSRGSTAFIVVITAMIWSQFGMAVLIFLSGMSSIEYSVLESALVDGANWWQRFFRIILPMIIGTIEFYMVVLVIIFFTASFGFIYSITSGGPGFSTTTLEYMIYVKAFKSNLLGQSSALATILFIIVLIIVIIIFNVFRKIGDWQE